MADDRVREPMEGGGGGPAAAPPARLARLPIVGPGLAAAADALAGLGRDHMKSCAEARRTCGSDAEARQAFARQARELLAPTAWSALAGVENAAFALYDPDGRRRDGRAPAAVGDFVRIDLPVFGLERCDWVRVEAIAHDPDRVCVVVRPSEDPTAVPRRPGITAHFFTDEATNAFTLRRDGATLVARVEGADERANTGGQAATPEDALRHRILAEMGWGLGYGPQQHQWERFTANLVAG